MKNEQDETAEDPVVISSHLAYFFLPLPDPLGMPDKYVCEILESTPPERVDNEELPPVSVGASLRFHRVEFPATHSKELAVLFDLAEKALPFPEGMSPSRTEASEPTGEHNSDATQPRITTVVEMVIALDSLSTEASNDEKGAHVDDQITEAFDKGIDHIRQFQRAYYLSQREPIRLTTRESLPPAIPFGVRQLFDDDGGPMPFEVPLSMYFLNMNVPKTDVTPWDDTNNERLSTAIAQQSDEGPFVAVMDLIRESDVALERDGAYRSAVLFTATACEVLFDELLAHMMWEEEERPEDAAILFGSGTTTARVKKLYHGRLGDSWKLDTEGPIRDWFVHVAGLRNRVIHGGYEPTLEEARQAVRATSALTEHLGDLVAKRAKNYPRTALILPGEGGLVRRGKWTSELDKLSHYSSEVQWNQTFARWRLAMNRAREDNPLAEVPSTSEANVHLVVRSDNSEQWVVHDPRAGMAAVISSLDEVAGNTTEQQESARQLADSLLEQTSRTDISIFMFGARVTEIPADRWLPEYRLLPQTGVMVTGNNLDPI